MIAMRKTGKRLCAALMAAVLGAGCAVPAAAAGADKAVQKDETVYMILNADGSVREQIVSDWLHSDTGFKDYRDESTLTAVENLKSDAQPAYRDGALVWDTDETDLYYQGENGVTPPVSVSIAYTLDGEAISAEALAGRSGHLTVRLSLRNNAWGEAQIGGGTRRVCTPFFTVCAAVLPADNFQNVTAAHGIVQSDSKTQLACFLALPGVSESLSGLIPEGLGEIEDYLLDDLTLEADVTDCTVPDFLFAAAPSMEALELDGDSLSGEMAELQDATQQLQDGAGALDEAVSALEGKLGEFAAGYAQFDAGVDAALSGTQALAQGGENLLENADLLSDKSGELAAGAGRLNAGAAELSGLLNTQLVPGLVQAQAQEAALREKMNALSGALDGVSIPDVSGLRDQLSAGAGQVFDSAASGAASAAAENTASGVREGCKRIVSEALAGVQSDAAAQAAQAAAEQTAAEVQSQYQSNLAAVLQGCVDSGALDADTMNTILNGMCYDYTAPDFNGELDLSPYAEAINAAIDAQVTVDPDAVAAQVLGAPEMQAAREQAAGAVASAVPDIDTAQLEALLGEFRTLSDEAAGMLGQVDALSAALYDPADPSDAGTVVGAASALAAGAEELSDGAAALAGGTGAFADGVGQLSAGAGNLLGGMDELSASSKTVGASIAQFEDGGTQLSAGTASLKAGMDAYADEAVGRLISLADPDSELGQTLRAMQDRAQAYAGTGSAENTAMRVKFIMRTEAAAAADAAEPEAETPAAEENSFWDRVLGLFS